MFKIITIPFNSNTETFYDEILTNFTINKRIKNYLNSRMNGLPFLGYRIFPSLMRTKRENIKRLKKKLAERERQFKNGMINEERFSMSLASLIGHTRFADSLQLRRYLFSPGAATPQPSPP